MKKPNPRGTLAPKGCVRVTLNMDAKVLSKLRMMAAARGVTMTAIIAGALKAKGIK